MTKNNSKEHHFLNRKILNIIPLFGILIFTLFPLLLCFAVNSIETILGYSSITDILSNLYNIQFAKNGIITISVSLIAAIIASLLGFYLSFFAIFLRNKLKYFIFIIVAFSFIINPIIHFQFFENLFGTAGIINTFLLLNNIISQPIIINDFFIVIISLIYKYIPISFLLCIPALHNTNTDLIESTLDLGANNFYVITNNIISDIKYHLIFAFGIIFMLCLGNFSIYMSSAIKEQFIGTLIFSNKLENHNTLFLSLYFLLFLIITIISIFFLNKYFNRHKSHLYPNPNKHLSKYKCIHLGRDITTISVNSTIIFIYLISAISMIFFSIWDVNSGFNFALYKDIFSDINI
jgi:ABC-type spermidine/putrescine transport system permease subunit I